MENNVVSIIIPVYNTEKYLEDCLNSITKQTYKNLEIICVDDCSPDNSIKILKEYLKKDNRLKIIKHTENKKQGGARNTGLLNAIGEYILFIDSDDFIDLTYIEMFVKTIETYKVDLVCNTNLKYYYKYNKILQIIKNIFHIKNYKKKIKNEFLNKKLDVKNTFIKNKIPPQTVLKFFKRQFLIENAINFPEKLKLEDFYFNELIKLRAKNVVFINKPAFHYRKGIQSTMSSFRKKKHSEMDAIYVFEQLIIYYKKYNFLDKIPIHFYGLNSTFKRQINKQNFINIAKETLSKYKEDILNNKDIYEKKDLDFFIQNCIK